MDDRIKKYLKFTGSVLAALGIIAYLVIVYILVKGFETNVESNKLLMFLALGAVLGVLLNVSLRIQGIDLAKDLEDSQDVIKKLNSLTGRSKETKLKPMWVMFLTTTLKDVIMKGGSVMFSLYFTINIIIDGMQDDKYFYLGIVNVFVYLGLAMLSMIQAYDYYIDKHIPFMNQKIYELERSDLYELKETKRDDQERLRNNEGCRTGKETIRDAEDDRTSRDRNDKTESGLHRTEGRLLENGKESTIQESSS